MGQKHSHGGRGGQDSQSFTPYQTGVWVLLIPIAMLFLGLTSSLVVRQATSNDWQPTQIPLLLGWNTLILLISSYTLQKSRRGFSGMTTVRWWLWLTNALGLLFLAGQLLAWKELVDQGVFLASNPSSSFFYVLTATHGVHLAGGMLALLYITVGCHRDDFAPKRQAALKAMAIYWHFMSILWIYLLLLLIFWR